MSSSSVPPVVPSPTLAAAASASGAVSGGPALSLAQLVAAAKAAGDTALLNAIAKGYVPSRQLTGKIVGLWGEALVRTEDGQIHPLKVGDVIKKGDVVLTTQDGIVQIEGNRAASADIERVIAEVGQGNGEAAPGAGVLQPGGDDSLLPGLRVDRISESVTPASFELPTVQQVQPQEIVNETQVLPGAAPDNVTLPEDGSITFDPRTNDTVGNGGELTITSVNGQPISPTTPVTLPQGVITLNPDGTLTFTPVPNFNGSFTVNYTATDGGTPVTSTITVNVTPVNDAPDAGTEPDPNGGSTPITDPNVDPDTGNYTATTPEDTPVSGQVKATDVDGDALTFTKGGDPTHGTVVVNPDGTWTYTPNPDYNGPDSFTVVVDDGNGGTDTAIVEIGVTPVNDPPDGGTEPDPDGGTDPIPDPNVDPDTGNYGVTTPEDTPVSGTVKATDPDGDDLTFTKGADPTHGTVVVNEDGTWTYTPNPDYNGPDSFTVIVDDGNGGTDVSVVEVNVTPLDDTPAAVNDSATTPEDTPILLDVLANDSDADGNALSITEINGRPVVVGTPVALTDAAGNVIGEVSLTADGKLEFTPAANYNGPVEFNYTATDGRTPVQATVQVEVTPVNDAPDAVNDRATVTEDTPATLNLLGNDSDPDGDPLSITAINGTPVSAGSTVNVTDGNGAVIGNVTLNPNGTVTFDPAPGYNGPAQFTYTVSDGQGGTDTATASIDVGGVNDAPVAAPDTSSTDEDTTLTLTTANGVIQGAGADVDPDGDSLSVSAVSFGGISGTVGSPLQGAWGTLTLNADGSYAYTPNAAAQGLDDGESRSDVFSYTVTDPAGLTSTTTLTLTVTGRNDGPVAVDDSARTPEDTPVTVNVLANDSDVDGDTLTVTAINGQPITQGTPLAVSDENGVSAGTVTLNADGTLTFTPAPNYNGPVDFTYTVSDGTTTDTGNVRIVVDDANDPPAALDNTVSGFEDTRVTFDPRSNDTDPDGDALTINTVNGQPIGPDTPVTVDQGVISMNPDGTLSFQPNPNYNGSFTFDYTVSDGRGGQAAAQVTVNVAAVDDLPVAADDSFSPTEDTVFNGNLATNDTPSGDGGNVWALGTGPAHGTVTVNADGTFTYTPDANYNGPDSFSYTLTDADGDVSTAVVKLGVQPVDDLPVAADDSFSPTEDTVFNGNLATNDTPSGDGGNVWALGTGPAHGTVTVNADGTFTYTPDANYNGPDSFSYTLTDADGDVSTAVVKLGVQPVDDLPVAADDSFSPTEDTVFNGNLATNDTPSGDGGNVWALGTGPAHGTVTVNADGTFTYTPDANYNGPDSFSYTLTDADGDVSTAVVKLGVQPVDDLPVAADDSFSPTEDTVFNGNLATNDTPSGDGGNVWALGTGPAHGTVTVNADGTFTYTPDANYNGPDSFSYTLTDADGDVSTAVVKLGVQPVDDLPVAADDSFSPTEDTVFNGNLATNDTPSGDGGNVWALGTGPAHGTVTVNADGTFTYTPDANYNGPDSFSYTLTDADGDVSTAVVKLGVQPVDDLPVAADDSFSPTEDKVFNGNLATNDTPSGDGGNVWALGTGPAHGTVTVNADGTFTYTPDANYNGPDSFSYTLTDADGDVSTAVVKLGVQPVDDLPVAKDDSFSPTEDTVFNGNLATNDTPSGDGGNVWALGTGPAHGTVTVNADGTFTYTPDANYNGPDSFSYTLTDADGDVSTAVVKLGVQPVDDLPVAADDSFSPTEDTVFNGNLATNDTPSGDGGNVWALGTGPAHGTVTVNADGTFTYTPDANYNGPDSFSYTLTDADGDVSTAVVKLGVQPVDDLPAAADDSFSPTEDTVFNGNLATNDTPSGDGGNVWALGTGPAHGTVTVNADGTFTYTPDANYNGPDSFSYTLTDADGDVSTAVVKLGVQPVDDLPVAADDSFSPTEDTVFNGNLATNDTPSGDGGNVWALGTGPAHGTVTVNADGTFTYTPDANYNGPDSFSYTLTDADGDVSTAVVKLGVQPVDDLPVAKDDNFSPTEDTVFNGNLATNDTPSGDGGNVWALGTGPAHGAVTVNADGTFTYTPDANYNGSDSFSYTLTDADGDVSTAVVKLGVQPVDDLPVAADDSFSPTEDTVFNGNLATNDTPSGDGGNVWSLVNGPAHGTVTVNADGTFSYKASNNYSGADSFTYSITDADGDVSTAVVKLDVQAVADKPLLNITPKTFSISTNFEETDVAGYAKLGVGTIGGGVWKTDNNGGTVEIGDSVTYGVNPATQVLELEQDPNDRGNFYTTVDTDAGEIYTLSFDFAARQTQGSSTNSVIYVYWEGQLVQTLNSTSGTLSNVTLSLLATTSGDSKLEFIAADANSYGGVLDNISLSLVPNTGVQGYVVNLPDIAASLTDTDGSESVGVRIGAIPVGATLTDGVHTFTATAGTTSVDVSDWDLTTLALVPPASLSGTVTLDVTATSTEGSNGSASSTTQQIDLTVLADTGNVVGSTGNDSMVGTTASERLWGLDGNDSLTGGDGNDSLLGGLGQDTLKGDAGNDLLDGHAGNDSLVGGAGADTLHGGTGDDILTGGTGGSDSSAVDVFRWNLGDAGTQGAPASDTITDFNAAPVSSNGDVLDLRDLLQGELAGKNMANYLDFDTTSKPGQTIIHISSTGGFTNGNYSAAAEDQTITLSNVNLRSAMGLGSGATDSQVIAELFARGKLVTDGL